MTHQLVHYNNWVNNGTGDIDLEDEDMLIEFYITLFRDILNYYCLDLENENMISDGTRIFTETFGVIKSTTDMCVLDCVMEDIVENPNNDTIVYSEEVIDILGFIYSQSLLCKKCKTYLEDERATKCTPCVNRDIRIELVKNTNNSIINTFPTELVDMILSFS
jgi:hypothetical protein